MGEASILYRKALQNAPTIWINIADETGIIILGDFFLEKSTSQKTEELGDESFF